MDPNTATSAQYLPFSWTITLDSSNKTSTCPSPSSILGTFAIVNIITSLLSLLIGHRIVTYTLTCGLFGHADSRSWKYMWIMPVGLQLGANAGIAFMMQNSKGYKSTFPVSALMLFLVIRPRLNWIALSAVAATRNKTNRTEHVDRRVEPERKTLDADRQQPRPSHDNLYQDYPWWNTFATQILAEIPLQIINFYTMGRTVHVASQRGYYKPGTFKKIPGNAKLMYMAALFYIMSTTFNFFHMIAGWFNISRNVHRPLSGTNSVKEKRWLIVGFVVTFMLSSMWLGSWLFWAGFVKLAEDLYCPPKLTQQAVIWISSSTIGVILGTGM